MSVAQAIREASAEHHDKLHHLPFFQALLRGDLKFFQYRDFLSHLGTIVSALEHELGRAQASRLTTLWSEEHARRSLLIRDVSALKAEDPQDTRVTSAYLPALELVSEMRRDAFRKPVSLAGYLYFFRAPSMRASEIRHNVARLFGLEDRGLEYLNKLTEEASSWKEWEQSLNRIAFHSEERAAVVSAGATCFAGMVAVVNGLSPAIPPAMPPRAVDLNSDAGSHSVTENPLELEAAMRAGERSLVEFPYLELRYGGRGRRFTASDSAWLVSLCDFGYDSARKQIFWLARVLAARGMPRMLLEDHLRLLHEELCDAQPDRAGRYKPLLQSADILKKERLDAISGGRFEGLVREYESRIPGGWHDRLRGMGRLLVGAVADERLGMTGTVEGLTVWLRDPGLFPRQLVQSAERTIAAASDTSGSH